MGGQLALEMITKELIKRKTEWDRLEKQHLFCGWAALISGCTFVILLNEPQTGRMVFPKELLASPLSTALLVVLFLSVIGLVHLSKKAAKKEKEFEALRNEFIERSEEFWPAERSAAEKEAYLKEMQTRYSINLFYFE